MSSSVVSRWVVARKFEPGPADLDARGVLRDDVLQHWIDEVRDAYLEQCVVLRATVDQSGLETRHRSSMPPAGAAFGSPDTVVVSAGVTEVHPESFTMALRLRSIGQGEDDVAVNVSCVVSLEDPATGAASEIDDAIRDEMISLEHAARHYN